MTLARWLWLAIGSAIVLLPVLPLPRWVGAADAGPIWAPYMASWGIGFLLIVAVSAAIGRFTPKLSGPPRIGRGRRVWWLVVGMAVVFTAASVAVMLLVFSGNPHLVDEMAHLLHARAFAAGRLGAPPPDPPEFFLLTHTLIANGSWVSQYPPVHTALLAVGLLFHAEWLVGPLLGGVSAVLVFVVARGLYGPKTGLIAVCLWCISAWTLFMSGTYMNHVSTTALAIGAWAAVFGPKRPRPWHLLVAGLLLGLAAANRPLDAVAAALPVGAWILAKREWRAVGWMFVGGAPVMVMLGWFNWRLFGSPTTFGYSALYGPEHGLGFHVDPYGVPYTPLVGLSNVAVALRRLHIYLYEWPVPALLPLAIWAVFNRRWKTGDLWLGLGLIAGPVLYFFYWHSGYYLGPRFYYIAVPFVVIGTARAWRVAMAAARRFSGPHFNARTALWAAAVITLLWGWADLLPTRIGVYREGLRTMKLHPERALAARGVERALVIVPESWSSRMIAGYWSRGVSQGLMERAFRRLDTCDLYQLLRESRSSKATGEQISSHLEEMLDGATSSAPRVMDAPDPWVRLHPREEIPPECVAELRRDYEGFTLFGNLAWRNPVDLDSGIVFARDLYERNHLLLERYPGWEVWRWAPPPGDPDGTPVLSRIRPEPANATAPRP